MSASAALLLAVALLLTPAKPARARLANAAPTAKLRTFARKASLPARTVRAARERWSCWHRRTVRANPLSLAAAWDLLATGMRGGIPVPVLLRATAAELHGEPARMLRIVGDRLELGADPATAWEPALAHPDTAELARAARRMARTGSGFADAAAAEATQVRVTAGQRVRARAHRAEVWVAAPLGLCFLPAFLCLGVLPVVVGMVRELLGTW